MHRASNRIVAITAVVVLLAVPIGAFAIGPTFSDVPPTDWAYEDIEWLAAEGLTNGCGDGKYCPDNPVTRREMAVFIHRVSNSLNGSHIDVPAAAFTPESDAVTDYRNGAWSSLWINADSLQAEATFVAPVDLPDGATVTSISVLAIGNEPGSFFDVVLTGVSKTNGVIEVVGGVDGSGIQSAMPVTMTSASISSPEIDADQYWYNLGLRLNPGTGVYGVEIMYTMP